MLDAYFRMGVLLALPKDAVFAVFNDDAFGEEIVADGIGAGEVAATLGLGPLGHQRIDIGVGERKRGREAPALPHQSDPLFQPKPGQRE